ncbi:alpha/beta-hydrolase [Polyplosphaeria fusca]|uniref:Carboxylic ester hydrolase n=1 Tax=Polyplosphaeria fusca TaxID=682080 RepID=A0A9P4V1E1_9PLEO|nr:alpha/beta-hydrolase [Polyplosphaeria fusca]
MASLIQSEYLAVNTTSGTYTGFVNSSTPDVNIWLGIPFGAPPVDKLRFLAAQKAPNYGAHPATTWKPICIQNNDNTSGVFWTLVPEFQNSDPQAEDCLYVNIWAPKQPAAKKEKVPVIIWVFGGAFQEGGGHAPYQIPDKWIQRTQSHIVVTFNYRVNMFGFPAAAGALGNPGITDVRLVVEWLRDNVEGFGGDKDRMVLWGQSAGGNAVVTYSYGYPDEPIVSGLIADSGVAPSSVGVNTTSFSVMAASLGCGNLTAADELACMQKVDALAIQKFLRDHPSGVFGAAPWGGYVADNVTIFANNTVQLMKGRVAKVPIILGANKNEGAAFQSFKLNQTVPPTQESIDAVSGNFVCTVDKEANHRAAYNLTAYKYLFMGNFSNITPRYWLGAMHSSELPVVFGTHDIARGNSTELEWQTSYAMEAFWTSFAANASKAPVDHLGQVWPKYTGTESQIVVFANDTAVQLKKSSSAYGSIYAMDTCSRITV